MAIYKINIKKISNKINILPAFLFFVVPLIIFISFTAALSQSESNSETLPSAAEKTPALKTASNGIDTKVYSLSVKRVPLGDTLHIIASEANLNLVFGANVTTDAFITVTFKNLPLKDAMDAILYPFGYFYHIEKNIIFVKAAITKHFELGSPPVIQSIATQLGGDILGGAVAAVKGATSGLTGTVSIQGQSDAKVTNFWDYIESSLKTILNVGGTGTAVSQTNTAAQTAAGQTSGGGGTAAVSPVGSTIQSSSSGAVLSINRSTGTIIITANKMQIEEAEKFINRVRDVINKQVVIEAKIVEITLSDGLKYGIDWSAVLKIQESTTTISQSKFNSVVSASGPLSAINFSSSDFTLVLQALEEQGNVKVLSNPTITIVNGQTGLLSAGRTTSFISKVERTLTQSIPPIETVTVETSGVLSGVIIGVTPYIKDDGEVVLMVTPIISELVSLTPKTVATTELSLPTVDLREMTSIVSIRDGEMIAIGGLIKEKNSVTEKSIPILGKIPIINFMFRNKEEINEKTELVLFLKPIIRKKERL